MTGIAFDSRKNYLKLASPNGAQKIVAAKPSTPDSDFLTYYSTVTINHNLGYRPMVRARFSPNNDDTWFPMDGKATESDIRAVAGMSLYIREITNTSVTFRAESFTPSGGQYTIVYKIYLDPTL